MEKLLIYQDNSSNKFWKITTFQNAYTITYGKIGSVGSVKTKEFDSEETCLKESEKLIQSKLKKGYIFASSSQEIIKESTMTEQAFWDLLEICKEKGNDIDEQMEWLVTHLSKKSIKDIIMFDFIFNQNYRKSYTSHLWAAGYIVMGGCSDDCFDYFRAWVLYLGKEIYETAIQNPESLLPYFKILENQDEIPQLEELLGVASMAYEEKTDLDDEHYYNLYDQLTNDDAVNPDIVFDWDEEDLDSLRQKFPLLWEAYGENPMF